ncbi:MAG: aspartate--ammonia ligase [Lachnospiraceae bacterium]|nr:aspartate--ammonia ligase [Lachnospiraceae bacterium]
MSHLFVPENYRPALNLYDTQRAIGTIKRLFADTLCASLSLHRVSAPLFLEASTGLNDDLNGVERKVTFDLKDTGTEAQVVQSLAKWKRMALRDYDFRPGKGLYTDMNAIRRDEDLDNLHSVYVDQWDWEKVITEQDRNEEYLKDTVRSIVAAVCATEMNLRAMFPQLMVQPLHSPEVTFITTQELEDLYPDLTSKERENAFVKEHGTTFLMKIGRALASGKPHDGRAPDYDDWDLNGDILFWNETLGCSYELSSMGIRVTPESLDRQLTEAGCDERRSLPFHKQLLDGKLPLTIGGGIGQSRLCMLLLGSAHIGEVQSSVWDEATINGCREAGIPLL